MTHGIYVHIPWCRARCPYCAFYVVPERGVPDWAPLVDKVLQEHAWRSAEFPGLASTVFLGGGTPSRLPPEALRALLGGLPREPGAEISAEVNPEDLTPQWLEAAMEAGVDRISLGVQSLAQSTARRLGRGHTRAHAEQALSLVSRSGLRSWSADLMFAVPGGSEALLWEDLDRLLSFDPPHLSLYGLTIEPGTRFERAVERGRLDPIDEDRYCAMYEGLVARLAAAGLHRYEVSNFARPGHRCRHNQLYWTDAPYLGLGPSAHGYSPTGERWVNVANLQRYLSLDDPTETREKPDALAAATDLWISALRSVEGLDLEYLKERTGLAPEEAVVARLVQGGLLERRGSRLMLTDAGFPVSDAIIARLVDATG